MCGFETAWCAREEGEVIEGKRFDDWNIEKKRLHDFGRKPDIKNSEIWWCSMGENIGVEINGKGSAFMRPVLVVRKLSKASFIGIPLTSQLHNGSWYVHFRFKNRDEFAVLAQIRTFSVQRLYRKMGSVDGLDMKMVLEKLKIFFFE